MHYSSVQPIKLKRKSTYHFLKEDFIEKSFMSCSRILLLRNPIVFDRRNWSQFVSCQDSLKLKYDFGYDKMPKPYGKIRTYLKCTIQKCILNFKIQTWRLLIGRFKHLALRVQPETAENKLRLMFKRCHIRIQKPQKVKDESPLQTPRKKPESAGSSKISRIQFLKWLWRILYSKIKAS